MLECIAGSLYKKIVLAIVLFNSFIFIYLIKWLDNTILVKSLHFSFIAMKQWKFQNHCDENNESNEIAKEKNLIIMCQIS